MMLEVKGLNKLPLPFNKNGKFMIHSMINELSMVAKRKATNHLSLEHGITAVETLPLDRDNRELLSGSPD